MLLGRYKKWIQDEFPSFEVARREGGYICIISALAPYYRSLIY